VYTGNMAYKAVLFDLDGTLLDTLRDIADSANAALEKLGFPMHNPQDYRYFVGEGMPALAMKVLPANSRNTETMERLITLIDKEYAGRWTVHTQPYPGIPELLDGIVAQGLKMAVFSNKPHEFTAANVQKLLPRWKFTAVIGASGKLPRKPDPKGAVFIAKQLGIRPEEILFLGDSGIDMQTAAAAGMYAVGALWGFRDADELMASGARKLINRPEELLKLLR
jgi:phosphoglycolate phosphatase